MFILYRLTFPGGSVMKRILQLESNQPVWAGHVWMNPAGPYSQHYLHCLNGFPEIMLFQRFILGEAEKESFNSSVNIGWNWHFSVPLGTVVINQASFQTIGESPLRGSWTSSEFNSLLKRCTHFDGQCLYAALRASAHVQPSKYEEILIKW